MKYGKFNSVAELQNAYAHLERAFTQKCQQLAELKAKIAQAQTQPSGGEACGKTNKSSGAAKTAKDVANDVADNVANIFADDMADDDYDLPWWMDDNHPVDGVAVNPSVAAADGSDNVAVGNKDKSHECIEQVNQVDSAAKTNRADFGEIQSTNIQNSYNNDVAQANSDIAQVNAVADVANSGDVEGVSDVPKYDNDVNNVTQCDNAISNAAEYKKDGTSEMSPPSADDTASREAAAVAVPDEKSNGVVSTSATMQAAIRQFVEQNPQFIAELLAKSSASVPVVMTGGGNFQLAAPNRPKTIKEASALAKKLFE